ncbi:Tautomerase [Penicillium cosmopolitanum]|uniref:L-dopachrome isomerase n=1 Tax=Penicillium cosmopolitanum TaxID=1131564 RepID=A0A9W9SJR0_9EURO|nr:Tautomerase [Penicillium cosmopolitanum]KAJ5378529.1 Tautomerase [Penicillium cosmopolitanum]
MEPPEIPKSTKPSARPSTKRSLPRLTTDIPCEEDGRTSVFSRTSSPDLEIKPERPARAPTLFSNENLAPNIRYGPSKNAHILEKSIEEVSMPKKPETKSTYYEEAFSSRGSHNSPRERIIQDSVVVAELTTSAKVSHPGVLMIDLSRHLALIYQRPEAAICLTVHLEAPLSFGNISLPAYKLKIYALPSVIAPTINMRSTTMLTEELQELLGIVPELGVILFIPVPQDNLAMNGAIIGSELSKVEQEDNPGFMKTLGQSISRRHFKSTVVERRRQLGVKKSVSNFMRRGLGRASKEKEEQQDFDKVEKKETAKPKKDDRVLRFEDEQ